MIIKNFDPILQRKYSCLYIDSCFSQPCGFRRFFLILGFIAANKRMYELCDGYACTEQGWPAYANACRVNDEILNAIRMDCDGKTDA